MTEPIGRKSIKKTLENLKTHVSVKTEEYKSSKKMNPDIIKAYNPDKMKERLFVIGIKSHVSTTEDTVRSLLLYIQALESYLSELDETFDKILEEAKKMAEKQIKEMPKERPEFYG